jgi:hypothetical protein
MASRKQDQAQSGTTGEPKSVSIGRGIRDANDSNVLRHDPIYKIACGRLPIAERELLASQPTITRLENHVNKKEVSAMRRRMVEQFINRYGCPMK